MKREDPELFQQAVELERHINVKRGNPERDQMFLHSSLVPLNMAVGNNDLLMPEWDMDQCESGYCFV